MLAALDKKLLRDLGRLWAQGLAVALVMACGVATLILAVGAYRSLEETRAAFYDRYRFGSVFATVVRAPLHLRNQISEIPGVSSVEQRIVEYVILDVPGMTEPATGLAVSIPDHNEPSVNRLYLRKGRLPVSSRANEVAVVETFADAHGFQPGDGFDAIINGRKRSLEITGIVLSPEFIYAIGPGDMVPDQRRFGVMFMPETVLRGLFNMEGAFNDLALTTLRNTNPDRVIETVDDLLRPYGGTGAYDRTDQTSNAFLDAELTQLRGMAFVIPPIFLFISAFLVNMILSRLISLEREQIGLLKAVGYGNLEIVWHYAKLVIAIALIGLAIGSVAGYWLGRGLTTLYAEFFSFPFLIFRQSGDLYFLAGAVTIAAALAGAARAVWTTVSLPPAVAMQPPAPTVYKSLFTGLLRSLRIFSQLTIMALRHLLRWPVRSFLTIFGTALSVALLVTAMFSSDSIDFMIDTIFFKADRQDATLTFAADRAPSALHDVEKLPGVLRAEPFRAVAVTIRNGHLEERMSIIGVDESADLSRVLDKDLEPLKPPRDGLMLSERVAQKLRLRPGDHAEIELKERDQRVISIPIAALEVSPDPPDRIGSLLNMPVIGVEQSYVGLTAHMRLDALNRMMMDGRKISGARIAIDGNRLDDLYDAVKNTPALASIALQGISRDRFRETIEQNINISMTVYIVLAVIITFGVIYNSARIQLSERARELASLRVFGFTRAEVSGVLLTELGIIVILAQPLGWLLGYGFSWSVIKGFESDLFRIPLIINPDTFAMATMIVLAAAVLSSLIVRRRIDRLDLIRVLKTRE